jgi:serine/threonine protein kinase
MACRFFQPIRTALHRYGEGRLCREAPDAYRTMTTAQPDVYGPIAAESRGAARPGRWDDYEVFRPLGLGGMAELSLARARAGAHAGRWVALKRILPHLAAQSRYVDMFLCEAEICARIRHRNVCGVYEYGGGAEPFMALEYLHGPTLGAVLARVVGRRRQLKLSFIERMFAQACAGVDAAHAIDVVHRDISPNNLLVTTDGVVKVLDFGVAKADFAGARTQVGTIKGKLSYMSPEQLAGNDVDGRADVFSLGVVLYELVTGRRLFRRSSFYMTCRAVTSAPIEPMRRFRPSVPEALDAVVLRALERDRRRRFASAGELAAAVTAAVATSGPQPSEQDVGRYIHRLFAQDLQPIDDLLSRQPTRVFGPWPTPDCWPAGNGAAVTRQIDLSELALRSVADRDPAEVNGQWSAAPDAEASTEPGLTQTPAPSSCSTAAASGEDEPTVISRARGRGHQPRTIGVRLGVFLVGLGLAMLAIQVAGRTMLAPAEVGAASLRLADSRSQLSSAQLVPDGLAATGPRFSAHTEVLWSAEARSSALSSRSEPAPIVPARPLATGGDSAATATPVKRSRRRLRGKLRSRRLPPRGPGRLVADQL